MIELKIINKTKVVANAILPLVKPRTRIRRKRREKYQVFFLLSSEYLKNKNKTTKNDRDKYILKSRLLTKGKYARPISLIP